MCGAKLDPAVSSVPIDDEDPLDLETPVYHFEDRSQHEGQQANEFRDRDRQRERIRDLASSHVSQRPTRSSTIPVKTFPPDTVQEEAQEDERQHKAPPRVSGIGGPSFLGLGYEGSNNGFVYDEPRKDGFVYDTQAESPEYLLEEVPRGISWRAWALMLLLLAGAGLGYVQWRASHNLGPDLASILARNGATVDPNHPVVTNESKPPAQKPNPAAADASKSDSAKDESAAASSDEQASSDDKDAKASSGDSATAKTGSAKSGDENAEGNSQESPSTSEKRSSAAKAKGNDENAEPESDGPTAKVTKRNGAKPAALVAEKPAQPKPLGDKDPLIIQAEKYLQGRGVRQNCSTGVNLLRQAMSEGNPEADVKMGALYWSGTCVTQSNVTAYQWFSRAHSLEPRNRWIERSRNSLWASMSPAERQRVGY